MKQVRKIFAFVVAFVAALAIVTPAFADDGAAGNSTPTTSTPTTGSIAVTTNFKDQTYTLYKLFDAEINFNADGTQRAINYKLPAGKSMANNDYYELKDNGFVVAKTTLNEDVMKTADYRTWAKSFGTQVGESKTATANNDASIKWDGIDFGYYYVDSTLGAFITVNSDNPNVEVKDKNELPSIDKEITGVAGDTTTLGTGDNTADAGQGANEKAIAQIGDSIGYKLTVQVKPGAEKYVVTDTLSGGLTAPAAADVAVSEVDSADVAVNGQTITVTFKQTWLDTVTENTFVEITYNAVLNSNAEIGEAGNPNTAKLTWGHSSDEDANYSEDDANVYTAQVSIYKQDDDKQPLAGAGFVIKNSANKYYKLNNGVVTWVDNEDDADQHTSAADGAVPVFAGLKNGTYTLVEKTVPTGFNKLADTTITIDGDNYTNTNLTKSATVTNNKGTVMPSTGGIGTTIFYIVGGVMVAGAVVFLLTKRRMAGTAE